VNNLLGAAPHILVVRPIGGNAYRAVHLIVRGQGRSVEIQVRTTLQDVWANVVEATADSGGDLKHGVEPPKLRGMLAIMEHVSVGIAQVEAAGEDGVIFNRDPTLALPHRSAHQPAISPT
jgi:hypothetical protein